MVEYTPQEQKAAPDEFEIPVADPTKTPVPEVEAYFDGLAQLNAIKVKSAGKNIYRLDELVRTDAVVGKYTAYMVSEFKADGSCSPIQIVTFIDAKTGLPLANTLNDSIKNTNRLLRSKGLAAFQKKRGVELRAASATKMKVQFVEPTDDNEKLFAELQKRLGTEAVE